MSCVCVGGAYLPYGGACGGMTQLQGGGERDVGRATRRGKRGGRGGKGGGRFKKMSPAHKSYIRILFAPSFTMRAASALVVALAATASAQFEDDSMSFDVWVGAAA